MVAKLESKVVAKINGGDERATKTSIIIKTKIIYIGLASDAGSLEQHF